MRQGAQRAEDHGRSRLPEPLAQAAETAADGMHRGELALLELLESAGEGSVDRLRAVVRIAGAASGAQRLDEVIELVAEEARSALGAASFSISRWERERGVLRTMINVGDLGPREERYPRDEVYPLNDYRLVGDLLLHGKAFRTDVDDPRANPAARELLRSLGKESEVGAPIVYESTMWGELWATAADGKRFTDDDMALLEAIAAQVATAIGRAELFDRVTRFAFEDPLTGLANRRGLDSVLREELARCEREGHELTLVICDVDGLKQVNDEQGHAAGDELLRQVAAALSMAASAFPGALVARLGGDEFSVVLPQCTLASATDLARGASAAVAREMGGQPMLSWGAAAREGRALEPSELLRAADAAQYAAKRMGGGRLKVSSATDRPALVAMEPLDRRALRSQSERESTKVVERVVEAFDDARPRSALDALELLAGELCRSLDAAAWSLSVSRDGERVLRTVRGFESEFDSASGLRIVDHADDSAYLLADYPQTARILAEEGAFVVDVGSPDADPAEAEVLRELGYQTVLAAAASAGDVRYLLELYGDAKTTGFTAAAPTVRVLVAYCARRGER